jgi:hypothetical protein
VLHERLETARQQKQTITASLANCELALSLYDAWSRKQELESSLTELEFSKVCAEHKRRFGQVEQQIASVSQELHAERQRRVNLEEPTGEPTTTNEEAWVRVLEDGAEAARRHLRIDETRRRIAKCRPEVDLPEVERSPDELREIIRQIRAAAAEWRAARQRWQQSRANARDDSATPPSSENRKPSGREKEATTQTRELREEIRRVQRETQHLLQPQLLSRPALIAIGLLFVVGTISLLAGFFLRMPGSNWTYCLIGLSSMFSASLLKWNLERPPVEQLRAQRTQIAGLMSRIEASRKPDSTKEMGSSIPPSWSVHPSRAPGARTMTDQALWSELVVAEKRWRDLLRQYELPLNLTPRGVIHHVRKQLRTTEPESIPSLEQLRSDLHADEAWLETWRRQCHQLLDEPMERIRQSSPPQLLDRLSAHRTRLQQTQLEARELAAREQARRGLIKLQRQRKRLVQKRQEILADAGVETSAELQQKLAEMQQAERWKQELNTLRTELDQRIHESGQPQEVIELLGTPSRAALHDLAERESAEVRRLDAEIRKLKEDSSLLKQRIRELAQPPNEHRTGWQLQQLARQMQQIQRQSVALELTGIIQTSVQPKRKTSEEYAVQRATQWLRHIWDRPDLRIEWEGDVGPLSVIDGDTRRTLAELSDIEQQQVVTCLQIALVRVMARRRIHLPILLRDTILVGDPSMAQRVAALLCEIATSGQQILLLTSEASVAAWFHDLGMPTLIVSRAPQPRNAETREPVGAVG